MRMPSKVWLLANQASLKHSAGRIWPWGNGERAVAGGEASGCKVGNNVGNGLSEPSVHVSSLDFLSTGKPWKELGTEWYDLIRGLPDHHLIGGQ